MKQGSSEGEKNMRYSKQRELVLQKVEQLCDHPTAEEIYDEAIKECPGLSLGTVYRNLNSLVDAGRVRRVCINSKSFLILIIASIRKPAIPLSNHQLIIL